MCAGGLFLSAFFPYFPGAILLILGGTTLLLILLLKEPVLPAFFLAGSAAAGLCLLFPLHETLERSSPRHVDFCIDAQPALSKNGTWVEGSDHGNEALLPTRIRVFVPESRLPSVPLTRGDCLSGTATPLRSRSPALFLVPSPPSYIFTDSDLLTFTPGSSAIDHLLRRSAEMEQRLAQTLTALFPEDTAGLLSALVLSDTRFLPSKNQEDFRVAGVSHLLSVSGEHMTLLALFLGSAFLLLLRTMPLPLLRTLSVHLPLSRIVLASTLPFLGLYTLMIGSPPAAVRAFLGFSLVTLLNILFIDLSFEETLGLSTLIMLMAFPSLAHSLSFLLSLLALWSLVAVTRLPGGARKREGVKGLLLQSFTASLVIVFVTAPLLGFLFKTATPSGIVSNPLMVPLAGDILLPLGFTDLAMLLSGSLPFPLWVATNGLAHGVLGLAGGFAALPASEISLRPLRPVFVFVFYGAFVLFLVIPFRSMRPSLLFLALLFCVALATSSSRSPSLARALSTAETGALSYDPSVERQNIFHLFR